MFGFSVSTVSLDTEIPLTPPPPYRLDDLIFSWADLTWCQSRRQRYVSFVRLGEKRGERGTTYTCIDYLFFMWMELSGTPG